MNTAPRSTRWWYAAALLLALVLRVAWLDDKPFWRDEASVALLVESPLRRVIDPQAPRPVPVGFVALAKTTALLPLPPEVAYRLVPLLAGLALVPLLGRLAAALGAAPPVPLLVVWLAAALPALVYYSRELKSYDLDALLATLAPLLALRLFGRAADGRRGLTPTAAGGTLVVLLTTAPWVSFGSAFAVAALLLWGWGAWVASAAARARAWWTAASVAYGVSFLAALQVGLARQTASPRLHQVWTGWHLDDGSAGSVAEAVKRFLTLTNGYVFLDVWPLAVPLALLGAWRWAHPQRPMLLWLYVGTGALTIATTLSGRYLLADGRLLLAALPPLLLAAANGLGVAATWAAPRHARAVALAVALSLAGWWSAQALVARRLPHTHPYFAYDVLHDVGPLLDRAAALLPAGEPLYIGEWASRPFSYYHRTRGAGRFADATVCVEPCAIDRVTDAWLATLRGRGWMLVTTDQEDVYTALLAARGLTPQRRASGRGAVLWAVEPVPPPSRAAPLGAPP